MMCTAAVSAAVHIIYVVEILQREKEDPAAAGSLLIVWEAISYRLNPKGFEGYGGSPTSQPTSGRRRRQEQYQGVATNRG